jgi:YD repeat-containing protein
MKTKILIFIHLLFVSIIYGQSTGRTLSFDECGYESPTYTARKSITFLPGFSYTPASSSDKLNAYIDESLIFEAEYSSSQIDIGRSLNNSLEVGTTNGSFDVNQMGAATYTIPIDIPAGTNNMQPNLALAYNSQMGNGTLGYGWSISGLSSITRGISKLYIEDNIDPVNFNSDDRFYLDGQMLILVDGDGYGELGSTYKLENEHNILITVQEGDFVGKIGMFVVHKPDGTKMYYGWDGSDNNSKEIISSKGFQTCYLSKIEDILGNTQEYKYIRDDDDNSTYIDKITYTSGTLSNEIDFVYDERFDERSLYYKGVNKYQKYLLVGIKVKTEGELIHEYEFLYYKDRLSSYLKEIAEYDGKGNTFNTLAFQWSDNGIGSNGSTSIFPLQVFYDEVHGGLLFPAASNDYITGDVDNNGQTDLLRKNENDANWDLFLNFNLSNESNTKIEIANTSNFKSAVISDFDGNGKNEILFIRDGSYTGEKGYYNGVTYNTINGVNTEQSVYIYDYSGNTLENYSLAGITTPVSGGHMFYGDFDGDKKTDILITKAGSSKMVGYILTLNPGDNSFNVIADADDLYLGSVLVGDFNGDGISDFVVDNSSTQIIYQNTGEAIEDILPPFSLSTSGTLWPCDVNGDGNTDIVLYGSITKKAYLSTGRGFVSFNSFSRSSDGKTALYYLNNDLEPDFMDIYKASDGSLKSFWKINPFGKYSVSTNTEELLDSEYGEETTLENVISGDFDGNGILDFIAICSMELTVDETGAYSSFKAVCNGLDDIVEEDLGLEEGDVFYLRYFIYFSKDQEYCPKRISKIIDGLNNVTSIQYAYKGNYSIEDETFPINAVDNTPQIYVPKVPMELVKSYTSPNGKGSVSTTALSYVNPRVHRYGRGFLGFGRITSSNSTSLYSVVNEYGYQVENDISDKIIYPYLNKSTTYYNSNPISSTEYAWMAMENGKIQYPYLESLTETDLLSNLKSVTTNTYLEVTDNALISGEQWVVLDKTSKVYGNDEDTETNDITGYDFINLGNSDFLIRKNTEENTYSIKGSTNGLTKTINYSYYENLPLVNTVIYNEDTDFESENYYEWDLTTSNITREGKTALNYVGEGESRYITNTYGPYSRFITEKVTENNTSFVSKYTFDHIRGLLKTETDPNGLVTRYRYGAFNRPVKVTYPEGIYTTYSTGWVGTDDDDAPENALYKKTAYESSGDYKTTYYDCLGRELRSLTNGFSGTIYTDIEYNEKGQVTGKSLPYYKGAPESDIEWVTTTYYNTDNRVKSVTSPGNNVASYSYSGPSVTTVENGISVTKTYNASGDVVSADQGGNSIAFDKSIIAYNGENVLQQTTTLEDGGVVTTYSDLLGRKIYLKDPDAGTYTYAYDGFGEMIKQIKPDGKYLSYTYDNMGRAQTETWYDANGTPLTGTTTTYDPVNALGAIFTKQNEKELVTYYYDAKARLNRITSEFDGGLMQKILEYDSYSRVSKEYYGLSPYGFGVVNEYNNGFLSKIKDEAGSTTYWEATGYDASGRLIGKKHGDNTETYWAYSNNMPHSVTILQNSSQRIKQTYNWDVLNMRLSSKVDYLKASSTATARTITEVYAYDDFNRLQKCTVGNKTLFDIQYDNTNGSITSNTNLGSYEYNDTKHKHAVTQVDPGILLNVKESIEYTPFDKVSHITEGSKSLDIYYGVDNERLFSLYRCGDVTIAKYYYFGNVEVTDGDKIKTQIYLYGPGGVWGLAEKGLGNVYTVNYLHTDYQGTIIANSNANGITAYPPLPVA